MRSSIFRCVVLTALMFGLAWYAQVSVAQRAYGEDSGSGVAAPEKSAQFDDSREEPMRFFDV